MGRQRVAFVDGKCKRAADLIAGPGVEHLLDMADVPHRLQQGHGALNVLHHRVPRRIEGHGRVRLRGQVGDHRMFLHVARLDVLQALPDVAELGVFKFTAQQTRVQRRDDVQSR